jgi:beta-1,4-mannosyl-glycoprotein beta-1,4-N-acetylglucosaminyltransferase
MDQIEKYLAQLINDPENDFINFELAYAYEKEKQYAAAVSYYLRCAEYTNNNTLVSECLIRCSFSMNKQGGRDQKELHYIKQAMGASPCSLEPYYIASLYFSWRGNHRDSYLYTCLGINIYENNIQKEKFIKDVGFSMYDLYYQKAFACSNIGKINESMQLYVKILQEFDIQDWNKENILKKIRELPEPNHPIVSYTKQTMDKLKYQFPNCEEINENFSQIYQDIFVLSMNDGKKNGTYFEVGAGYPIKGNNTFLLETQFDWQGISIDIHPDSKDLFDKNRKNECICKDATSIDYIQLFSEHYKSTSIDYLQLDCDPANITYDILEKIPFDTYKFGVITYEHDFYNDHTGSYREKSRSFLKSKGYKLICGNISPLKDKYPFEDWWIHPDLIDYKIWKLFLRNDDEPINGEKYMLTKKHFLSNNYKNFISIGGWCGAKIALKKLGLFDEASLPFDDVRSSMKGIIDCFENNFENYFPKEIIEDNRSLNCPHFIGEYIGFYHDNHNLLDINVIESFKRKIVRFDKKIKKNNCIFIRTICREKYDDEIKQYKNLQFAIDKKYPNISYIICFIIPNQVNTQYYKHIDNRTFLFTLNDTSLYLFDGIVTDAYKPIFDFIMDTNLFVNIPEPNVIEIIDAPSRLWLVQPEGHPMVNFIKEKAETIIDNKHVAFWDNQLCERGTTVAMYDYAYYNQTILGNKSYIFYDKNNPNNKKEIIEKFKKHFVVHETDDFKEVDEYLVKNNISHIYIQKSGELDSRLSKVAKNCIHCVFTCSQPHGEVYSSISSWVQGNHNKYPVVPYMVNLPKNNNNMREKLNIPKNAIVFGGYGGKENFNIKFVQNVVCNIVQNNDNIYFLFANFHKFCQDFPNIIHLPMITNLQEKVEFINTCDAMLWARQRGETFGSAIAEFSTLNKPVISTRIGCWDMAHIHLLKDKAIWYNNEKDLTDILLNFNPEIESKKDWNAYKDYTPEKVMKIFDNVFLKDNLIDNKAFMEKKTKMDSFVYNNEFDCKIYSPKIIDCFIFYNELDLLNYRLNLLDDYVDYFVLVEATHTHTGKEKKLFYNENKELFEKFKDKIIHIIVHDFPYKYPDVDVKKNQQWENENFQRNCIKRGIDKLTLHDNDLVVITDLDEIPNPEILNKIKENKKQITISSLKMDMYYYNLNCKTKINDWIFPKIISYKEFTKLDITIHDFRYKKIDNIIKNGGWHLSFFGDKEFIANKIENYGHQEFNNDEILKNIEEKIKSKKDLFNRENHEIQYIDIEDNENLPPKYDIYLQKYFSLYINGNTNFVKDFYDFIPCHDQKGNDIYRVNKENLKMTLQNASNDPSIVAINTEGYVKNKIEKLEQIDMWGWDIKARKADGIYIKKTINDTLVKCSKSSIPVLGTLVCTTTKWIKKQLDSIDFPIENYIIINNNTPLLAKELDEIVSNGHKFIKNLKVYHMPYNLGCAEGWNTIIKSFLFSPYWVIVNDDVSFTPGFLKELHETALENPDAGMVHGKPIYIPNMNKFGSFDMFLIRDWVIKDYGLFDINYYPAYLEDYDYIFRLRNSSVKIINQLKHKYYHGDTLDYNVSGKNTQKFSNELSNKLINIRYKNYNYFLKKWNACPENINENNINDIYKYPFNNPENNISLTTFDINFVREKSLQDILPSFEKKEKNTFEIKLTSDISFPRPNVIVIDNFYKNVDEIREYALSQTYQSPENHGAVGYRCESGKKIMDGTKEMFEKLMGGTIPNGSKHGEWGYSTNGCFQWCNARVPIVYHCDSQKYAGIIYLTPNAPPNCGTSFFRHKNYKIRNSSIFSKSDWYKSDLNHKEPHLDKTQWEIVDSVGNVYNRLVIFDAQYIHAVTEYFGEDINNSRLFQLFFFNIN